ncbi:MAG TPA: hypothetical protein VFG59_19200 [Anaeromyxobacter sp.]|nr:hypothetical protein [Anaeromyxobacter sp.]
MMARRRLSLVSLAGALLFCGCAMFHHRGPQFKPISDTDYGRLAPSQLGPVDQARSRLFEANDSVARAKLELEKAQHEGELARADQTAARADTERARAEQDAAHSSNDPTAKARAQEDQADAELRTRSAQGHAAYAQRLVEARQAEVEAATQLVNVRQAELERAKLTALSQARIPAATKYDPAPFDAHVADAEQAYQQARASASEAGHAADQARNDWSTLDQQYQARIHGQAGEGTAGATPPPGQQGTGSAGAPASPPPAPPPPPPAAPPPLPRNPPPSGGDQ